MWPKVFCIGFHKTGTTSLGRALATLGYRVAGPFGTGDPDIRATALRRAMAIAREHDAVQDNPWPLLYRALDRAFPGSRFVLTLREPERWLASALRFFGEESTPMREWIYGAGSPVGSEDAYRRRFECHNREVREYFRGRDDLLTIDLEAGDGWERLCGFLGLGPPDLPFPHLERGDRAGATDAESRRGRTA
jgi:hypothetical protein